MWHKYVLHLGQLHCCCSHHLPLRWLPVCCRYLLMLTALILTSLALTLVYVAGTGYHTWGLYSVLKEKRLLLTDWKGARNSFQLGYIEKGGTQKNTVLVNNGKVPITISVGQDVKYQDNEMSSSQWKALIICASSYTCAVPAMTGQTVCWKKVCLSHWPQTNLHISSHLLLIV